MKRRLLYSMLVLSAIALLWVPFPPSFGFANVADAIGNIIRRVAELETKDTQQDKTIAQQQQQIAQLQQQISGCEYLSFWLSGNQHLDAINLPVRSKPHLPPTSFLWRQCYYSTRRAHTSGSDSKSLL